jgi:hypothetical protein
VEEEVVVLGFSTTIGGGRKDLPFVLGTTGLEVGASAGLVFSAGFRIGAAG